MNTEPNPDNPLCPICGASDWYSEPGVEFGLWVLLKDGGPALKDEHGEVQALPVQASFCRSCRFVRLHSARGDLETRLSPE